MCGNITTSLTLEPWSRGYCHVFGESLLFCGMTSFDVVTMVGVENVVFKTIVWHKRLKFGIASPHSITIYVHDELLTNRYLELGLLF